MGWGGLWGWFLLTPFSYIEGQNWLSSAGFSRLKSSECRVRLLQYPQSCLKTPGLKKKKITVTQCWLVPLTGLILLILYTRVIQQHLIRWHWSQYFHFLLLIPCYPLHSFTLHLDSPYLFSFLKINNWCLLSIRYYSTWKKYLLNFFSHIFFFIFIF